MNTIRARRRSPAPWRVLLGVWLLVWGAAHAGLAQKIPRIKESIVGVGTLMPTRQPPGEFLGTGFVVGGGRLALTNAHVLPSSLDTDRKERLVLFVGEGQDGEVRRARKVALDARHDLALLRFEGPALPSLSLGDSDRVREGERYAFTGFPIGMVLGLHPVTHRGIVSAVTPIATPMGKARQLDPALVERLGDPYEVFQLDATAYPGNSGSPLYDPERGRVVGVVNMVFVKESKEAMLEKPSGITYAIPIKHALRLLRRKGALD
ncbi:S1 family peptidase [Thiohalorhabdus sp. Cl-TMA]|uniref:Serine protease n=1 Tax=Thiohalorhabdus methylotrophus TaxID=3242694 RepID=A0ABV4TUI3_9GAMM